MNKLRYRFGRAKKARPDERGSRGRQIMMTVINLVEDDFQTKRRVKHELSSQFVQQTTDIG